MLIDYRGFLFSQIDDPFLHSFVFVLLVLAAIASERRGVRAIAAFPVLDAAFRVHQLDVLLQPCLEVKLDAAKRAVYLGKTRTPGILRFRLDGQDWGNSQSESGVTASQNRGPSSELAVGIEFLADGIGFWAVGI